MRNGQFDTAALAAHVADRLNVLAPALALAGAGLLLVFWTLARWSDQVRRSQLERRLLCAERDAAARSATEARLRLLQGQIRPHFIFNTLATLQHWVDRRDDRAGPLLHELTGFLRRSTELLDRSAVPLAEEVQAVRHYLAILQARLGSRLQVHIDIDPALAARELPPGLVLTLVENAIEHGLEPCIDGGRVTLQARPHAGGWSVTVEDDGAGLPAEVRHGVGLTNLCQRLLHHYGEAASFSLSPRPDGGTRAELRWQDGPQP